MKTLTKKDIPFILLVLGWITCFFVFFTHEVYNQIPPPPPTPKPAAEYNNLGNSMFEYKIDGCEYLVYSHAGHGASMLHKATCPNVGKHRTTEK